VLVAFCLALPLAWKGWSAGERLYFTGVSETNLDTAAPQALLVWGPLERMLPDTLTGFRLYRRQAPAPFALIAETDRNLIDSTAIGNLYAEPGEGHRYDRLADYVFRSSGMPATGEFVFQYLHDKLAQMPGDPEYNPLEQLLLARMFFNASRSIGQAYIDRDVASPGVYEYMLTGLEGTSETLPLGKTMVDVGSETVLPPPTDFEQVFVGGCSSISRGVDDRRIHFRWDIPTDPAALPLRILTYGYELYRSETDLGLLDLRMLHLTGALPEGLVKVSEEPVVVAGPAPEEGRDSFLALDEGDPINFNFLQRGKEYFYYLVALDLSGKYSQTAGPLAAEVPDTLPPPAPWNVHTEEVRDEVMTDVPRMQIVWDEITPENYWREYGSRWQLVDPPSYANPLELYYIPREAAPQPRNYRETDLETMRYVLFRFYTQEEAQRWGVDSDGDYWPDNIEDASGTDPCDIADSPAGDPPQLAAVIDFADTGSLRTLSTGVEQRFFVDTVPQPDNHVYWYKILAIDSFENQGPLSPPIRGVLWDREQPEVDGDLIIEDCDYRVVSRLQCETNEQGPRFRAFDMTDREADVGIAEMGTVRIFEVCPEVPGQREARLIFLAERPIRNREATFFPFHFPQDCVLPCGNTSTGILVFKFYDSEGNLIATSEEEILTLCSGGVVDCFDLIEDCRRRPPRPGEVVPPGDNPEICVDLEPGMRARVYHEIGGNFSPFLTISATHEIGVMEYCEPIDLTGIVPTNTCLGLRVFTSSNVGSPMKFLNCIGLEAFNQDGPPTPLLHSVDPTGTEGSPTFTVRWACQGPAGLSAFVLAWKNGPQIRYETYWVDTPLLTYTNGLYEVELPLDPVMDVNVEWCFEVRAIDKILQSSGWSPEMCNTWELGDPEQLPWPPVPDVPVGDPVTAFFLGHPLEFQPVLVLSGDLTDLIEDPMCGSQGLDDCINRNEPCLGPVSFSCNGFCEQLRAANRYGEFIVYRQEMDKDFVQVGPLVETFFCYRAPPINFGNQTIEYEVLDDPYIYLIDLHPSWVLPSSLQSEVDGPRLIYADPYPCKAGTMIRYQLVQVDPVSGEGISVHYSQWLEIP
jgi:hypothetical protein